MHRILKKSCSLPITIKHRIGVDEYDTFNNLNNFVRRIANAGADRFTVHARKAILKGLNPKQNRTIPPLKYDVVKIKDVKSRIINRNQRWIHKYYESIKALNDFDGVMIDDQYIRSSRWSKLIKRYESIQYQICFE